MAEGAGTPRSIWLVLVAYTIAFLLSPPRALLIVDEEAYVAQAVAFASGARTMEGAGRTNERMTHEVMSDYPPGTSALQAPFVAAFGWRFAALASLLSMIVATLATVQLLRLHGRDPRFALLVPGFLGTAFFARSAMSDVPSAIIVSMALLCLTLAEERAGDGTPRGVDATALLGGFLAGASILFRELNIVLLAPFLLSASWRHRHLALPILVGTAAGVGTRLAAQAWLFGNALYVRDSGYGFALEHVLRGAPLWGLILVILVPGGLLLPALYRGERRWEYATAVSAFLALYVSYGYDAIAENGSLKGAVLTSRFVVPALPLLAVMAAEVWPRLWRRVSVAMDDGRRARAERSLLALATVAAVAAGVVSHVAARQQESIAAQIIEAVFEHADAEVPLVVNARALGKFVSPIYGVRQLVGADAALAAGGPEAFTLALLDRFDSEMFARDRAESAALLERVRARCRVATLHASTPATWARLHIYSVRGCGTTAVT